MQLRAEQLKEITRTVRETRSNALLSKVVQSCVEDALSGKDNAWHDIQITSKDTLEVILEVNKGLISLGYATNLVLHQEDGYVDLEVRW